MIDAVVVGAGIAGVTAARDLRAAGLEVVVVDAGDRIGGRIRTDREFCGHPVELGAEFIHTMEADTWPEVRAAGLSVRPCDPNQGFILSVGGRDADELLADPATWEVGSVMTDITGWDEPDVSARTLLLRHGFEGAAAVLADATLTLHAAGDPDQVGVAGLRDDRVVELEEGIDHRIDAGYDSLPLFLAAGLSDVRLGWEVGEMEWGPDRVAVRSVSGDRIEARAGVCTLPVGVLASGAVRFSPPLTDPKQQALAGLEMGAVLKILLRFDEPFWPPDTSMINCDGPVRLYWPPLLGVPDAPAVLTAYATGYRAKALSGMDHDAAVAVCTADLERIFPGCRAGARLLDAHRQDWVTDPLTRGGYSFVRVGGAGSRAALAAADTGALFWAGDGTATTTIAAVVHAAYATGRRAADELIRHLGGT